LFSQICCKPEAE